MYKLKISSRGFDDLSIGFDRSRDRRKQELHSNKNVKGKYPVRIYLKNKFGSAEICEKAFSGLRYQLILTRNNHNAVLDKHNAFNIVEIKTNGIDWYVLHYTPSIQQ